MAYLCMQVVAQCGCSLPQMCVYKILRSPDVLSSPSEGVNFAVDLLKLQACSLFQFNFTANTVETHWTIPAYPESSVKPSGPAIPTGVDMPRLFEVVPTDA